MGFAILPRKTPKHQGTLPVNIPWVPVPRQADRCPAWCPQLSTAVPNEHSPETCPPSMGGCLLPYGSHLLGRNVGTLTTGGVGKGSVQGDLCPVGTCLLLWVKSFPFALGRGCSLWGQATWMDEELPVSTLEAILPVLYPRWLCAKPLCLVDGTNNGIAVSRSFGKSMGLPELLFLCALTSGSALWTPRAPHSFSSLGLLLATF